MVCDNKQSKDVKCPCGAKMEVCSDCGHLMCSKIGVHAVKIREGEKCHV